MIKINLLPVKEEKKRVAVERQLIAFVVIILLTIVGVAYTGYLRKSQIRRLQNRVAEHQRELQRLKKVQEKVNEFTKANEDLEKKISVITSLEKGRDWYLQLIDQLAQAKPEGVWLLSIITPKAASTGSIYKGAWQIKGAALEKDLVSNFILEIKRRNKYFSGVYLRKITLSRKSMGEVNYYQFDMDLKVKPPPAKGMEAS